MNWYSIIAIVLTAIPFMILFFLAYRIGGWRVTINLLLVVFFILAWYFFISYFYRMAGWQ